MPTVYPVITTVMKAKTIVENASVVLVSKRGLNLCLERCCAKAFVSSKATVTCIIATFSSPSHYATFSQSGDNPGIRRSLKK